MVRKKSIPTQHEVEIPPAVIQKLVRESGRKKGKYVGAFRIQVTLSEENYRLLQARAERAGTTMSAVAGILLDTALHTTPQPCFASGTSTDEGYRRLQQSIDEARAEIERRGIRGFQK